MERQSSEEEICSTAIFCGACESFLRVIVPRTPSRCRLGSTRASRSYFVKVNASRSRENAVTAALQKIQRRQQRSLCNFISLPATLLSRVPYLARASAGRFHTSQQPLRPTRSAKELCPASESTPENRTSS